MATVRSRKLAEHAGDGMSKFDDQHHHVVLTDPVAVALADQFLPPDGTAVTAQELATAVRRLQAAVREAKRRGNGVTH